MMMKIHSGVLLAFMLTLLNSQFILANSPLPKINERTTTSNQVLADGGFLKEADVKSLQRRTVKVVLVDKTFLEIRFSEPMEEVSLEIISESDNNRVMYSTSLNTDEQLILSIPVSELTKGKCAIQITAWDGSYFYGSFTLL